MDRAGEAAIPAASAGAARPWLSPRATAALGAALVLGGAGWVAWSGASPPAWYPPCLWHEATGWHCPGCGSARALHALGRADWLTAWRQNALAVATLPMLACWALLGFWRGVRANQRPLEFPNRVALTMLVVVLAFAVLRNLPWPPFVWLAPVE